MDPGPFDLSHLHRPVLVSEVLTLLAPSDRTQVSDAGDLIVDGTVGYGGHAEAMLRAWPRSRLLGIDRDREALMSSKARLADFGPRVRLFHASYAEIADVLEEAGETAPRAILLDVGVSSPQLDRGERGFSFREPEAPADMRFDRDGGGRTAADVVNESEERELASLIFEHGGERHARAVARALVAARPVRTLGDVIRAVERIVRRDASGIHPATRTLQALRIAVNDEAGHMERGLRAAIDVLAVGGRLAVISFHGGEERAVKAAFLEAKRRGRVRVLTAKGIRPTDREVADNARASSARLRAAERTDEAAGGMEAFR
jgi:16S rRNA (cytosine1402-N4)-methyltransferase